MKVLLATDGSERSEIALELAASLDWPRDSVIRLTTVVEPLEAAIAGAWAPMMARDLEAQLDEFAAEAATLLEQAARRLSGTGASVEHSVPRGRASSAIVAEADDLEADLIVVGSRGHGRIGAMVLGSVSEEVIDHAQRPVLVARLPRLTRVILGVDGSSHARAAEDLVGAWSIFANAAVEVTSVVHLRLPWTSSLALSAAEPDQAEYIALGRQVIDEHQSTADQAVERLKRAGRRATSRVVEGDAASELVRIASEDKADMIVVGTHGRTGLDRLLLGSVARNVLHHAPCSVLVVHRAPA